MNKKISRILGTAVAVALLVSLVLSAVPVSADTLSVRTAESIPGTAGKLMVADADIADMDVGFDGTTVWAVDGTGKHIYKSADAGFTWVAVTAPTTVDTTITSVAIAPDDVLVVGIIADDKEVYVTKNGGSTWTNMGTVEESGASADADHLFDIALAPLVSGVRYIAVAGDEAAATAGAGNVWYFNLGSSVPKWIETNDKDGFDATSDEGVFAIAFSPAFPSDKVMLAITGPSAASADTLVKLQVFSFSHYKWNDDAGFTGYAATVDTITSGKKVTAADIAFSADYLGADPDTRVCFVTCASDDATNLGSLNRFNDSTIKVLKGSYNFESVAYNTSGDKLVAGAEASNQVYRLASASTGSSTGIKGAATYKKPGGYSSGNAVTKVKVGWTGDAAVAGTIGDESAFSVSNDDGKTFNDVSLIDTAFTKIEDIQVNADGTTVYMLTNDGADLSLWRKASSWQRVFCLDGDKDYIVRLAPDDNNVVYIAKKASTTVYYTNDGGDTKWLLRYCAHKVQDMAVESADVVYALCASNGKVSKTTNAGFIWSTPKDTKLTDGYSLYLVSTDNLIVGAATEGNVAFSTDGNSSWTKMSSNTYIDDWNNVVVCAASLESGQNIYAGTAGDADKKIRRRSNSAGSTTGWTSMTAALDDEVGEAGAGIKTYGIDIVTRDNSVVLYALCCDGDESWIMRTLTPTASATSPPKITDSWSFYNSSYEFERAPRALWVSQSSTATKLWFIDTDATVYSFSDTIFELAPPISGPADGSTLSMNKVTGRAMDVPFSWNRASTSKQYDFDIALDADFKELVFSKTSLDYEYSDPISAILGPYSAIDNTNVEFQAGKTYYWRVRVAQDGPIYSPWSTSRSFTMEKLVPPEPVVQAPAPGAQDVILSPTFAWGAVDGASQYKLELADNAGFKNLVVMKTLTATVYKTTTALAYSTTYWWRVNATTTSGDSAWTSGIFTTIAEPTPPIVVEPAPAPVITLPAPVVNVPPAPAPVAPGWIYAIIAVGGLLVIVVIVLIVRTRRPV